ncbi:MAG: T9SS type A sorting domain-containing protein [candidate division KSB1 bacterium]|nr:T9SS type A sorting domain-containing protein [candidate division KSB1 bacterium]MDZ7333718.1 T9SS type A sorting domain-containing protein [candidate division KSB1 bacterium]MDZ7358149.1 T9SS type A sorting domain-containing protein [candidate division KSB1 bacterium]MDZ7375398.1 T9SS type A sorting domain-containing protein [candidate division KSB1 bacterium]MDZ7398856.1 T9SS type A sorting domain-containing protein [candidate division KSB1 bacterium]
MQRWKLGRIFVLSAIIIAWGINDGFAQVKVTIADVAATPKSTASVAMLVSDLSNYEIISYQFEILYDSLVARAKGVAVEGTITAPWGSPAVNLDSAGRMLVGNFGTRPLSPGDTLLKLIFAVVGLPGDTSTIILKDFQFNNGNPMALSKNGRLKVLSPSGVAQPSPIVPRKAIYLSNSPEPFCDRTTIQMIQPSPGAIDIEIYNVLGQRIKRLGNFDSNRSLLEIDWDATDQQGGPVPAGIYFCMVRQFNRILAVDRMIFIK